MASFFADLFSSILTPGPTHSLLLATNVSFAALQVVFLALLLATFSVHFVVLSFLSAGLWWAINWFVVELKAHEAAENEKAQREKDAVTGGVGSSSESDTDAQTIVGEAKGSGSREVEVQAQPVGQLVDRTEKTEKDRGTESPSRSKSDVSTEDEWERVSENEKDK